MYIIKIKEKSEYIFNEKLIIYDKIIKEILNINDIQYNVYY